MDPERSGAERFAHVDGIDLDQDIGCQKKGFDVFDLVPHSPDGRYTVRRCQRLVD